MYVFLVVVEEWVVFPCPWGVGCRISWIVAVGSVVGRTKDVVSRLSWSMLSEGLPGCGMVGVGVELVVGAGRIGNMFVEQCGGRDAGGRDVGASSREWGCGHEMSVLARGLGGESVGIECMLG